MYQPKTFQNSGEEMNYWFGNSTIRQNSEWEGGYSSAELAGARSYRNMTRKAKLHIAEHGVNVQWHSDITSGDVLALIFHADRHIEEATQGDRSTVTAMLALGSRAAGRVEISANALGALRRIHDLH